jgi:hypothetical protein
MRACCGLAVALHIVWRMRRFFLSGQTTCALLLGAGLLLRAQAALRPPERSGLDAKTRPSEMAGERAPRQAVVPAPERSATARSVQKNSHKRKGFTHRDARHRERKCGVALAERGFRCG